MKKSIMQIATLGLLVATIISCGENVKEAPKSETHIETTKYDWVDLDLSTRLIKYPIIVKAPKGYQLKETTESQITISYEKQGLSYRVYFVDPEYYNNGIVGYVESAKVNAKNNVAYTFDKFILETPTTFIAKTSIGYLCFSIVKAGDKNYACDQIPSYAIESEEDAQELLKMMGMLKLKK